MVRLPGRWRRALIAAVAAAAVLGAPVACGSANPLGGGTGSADLDALVVGSADFPESKILAEIYAQVLETNGFTIGRQFGIGSRETYIPAVRDRSIDLIPEYTGNLLQYFDPETTATDPVDVELALHRALPGDLAVLTPSPAADSDTVTVTAETAQQWNLSAIGDLAPHSQRLRFAAPSEFANRAQGLRGLREKYGVQVAPNNFIAISDGGGPATVRALTGGTVDAANLFSTSPAIRQHDLVVLEDPEQVFMAGNVVPLVSAQKLSEKLKRVLDAVSARLSTADLGDLNAAVSGNDGIDPDEAARNWLHNNGFDVPQ